MSFEEKSNLATLVIVSVIFGGYFISLASQAVSGGLPVDVPGAAFGPVFIGLSIGLAIWMTLVHILLGVLFSKDAEAGADERDRQIETRADAGAGYVLGAGVFAALFMLVFNVSGYWIAHALLAALVASEVYKGVRRAILYRLGV